MRTVAVPHSDWTRTLDEFSATHEGWLVSLDVLGPDIGAQPEISNLPLLGVSADRIEEAGTVTVTISAARSAGEHVTHVIDAATRLYVERTEAGADVALAIDSADGTKSILRFRATALPETVDGIVHR